ncbi:MAG: hypothetical protein ACWIPH_05530 [Ostreibacterium sp.]
MKIFLFFLGLVSLPLYAVNYKVSIKGVSAGSCTFTIHSDTTSYQVDLLLYPSLLAKMFGIDDMKDISNGVIKNNHFYPKSYSRVSLKGNKTLFTVEFLGEQAKFLLKGKSITKDINLMGQDPLTQIAQIQFDLRQSALASKYYLVTEDTQRVYAAVLQKTANGDKVILTQILNADRIITLWFDNEIELQRMQKQKRKKIDFDMVRK